MKTNERRHRGHKSHTHDATGANYGGQLQRKVAYGRIRQPSYDSLDLLQGRWIMVGTNKASETEHSLTHVKSWTL
jgi:hypothetical protein